MCACVCVLCLHATDEWAKTSIPRRNAHPKSAKLAPLSDVADPLHSSEVADANTMHVNDEGISVGRSHKLLYPGRVNVDGGKIEPAQTIADNVVAHWWQWLIATFNPFSARARCGTEYGRAVWYERRWTGGGIFVSVAVGWMGSFWDSATTPVPWCWDLSHQHSHPHS